MAYASLVNKLAVRVGYVTQTSINLLVIVLQDDDPIVVNSPHGQVTTVVPLTGVGDDNPSSPGEYVAFYAHVMLTGLSVDQDVVYSVTCGDLSVTGTIRTMPNENRNWAFTMTTCEHGEQFGPLHGTSMLREFIEKVAPTRVYFHAHIDDNGYPDSERSWGRPSFPSGDVTTGLQLTKPEGVANGDPQDTGLAWDYAIQYVKYFGMLDDVPHYTHPDRKWLHNNIPLVAQFGDHEVASNWLRGYGGQGNWYGPKESPAYSTATDFAEVGVADFYDTVAIPLWEAFFGMASPPKISAAGQQWGFVFGSVCFVAPDANTFVDGRHDLNIGSGSQTGRQADGSVDVGATGDSTLPYYGTSQITDILQYYTDSKKPFNVMFTSNGIWGHNEPWAQWWVDDFDDFVTRASIGVLNNPQINGQKGKLCVLKGDSHAQHVTSINSNGTAGGMGGASYDGDELWEWCPATVNGSATAIVTFPYKILGGQIKYLRSGTAVQNPKLQGFLYVEVFEEESPKRMKISMVDTTEGLFSIPYAGEWVENVQGNGFRRVA